MHPGFPQNQNPRQVSGKKASLAIGTAAEVPPIGSGQEGVEPDCHYYEIQSDTKIIPNNNYLLGHKKKKSISIVLPNLPISP